MADEDAGIGFLYSGPGAKLPAPPRLANDKGWDIDGERVTLIVERGSGKEERKGSRSVGVPYDSWAWLILLRLQ